MLLADETEEGPGGGIAVDRVAEAEELVVGIVELVVARGVDLVKSYDVAFRFEFLFEAVGEITGVESTGEI